MWGATVYTTMTRRARSRRAATDRSAGHDWRERGAVAVEAALVTPVFILIVFGILEFGLLFKDWLAVSSSVRAAVRIASAEPRVSTYATDAAANVAREGAAIDMTKVKELWVYRAEADGSPEGDSNGDFSTCTSCVKFGWNGAKFVITSDQWAATAHNACLGDTGRNDVGVYVKYDHPSLTKLVFSNFGIRDHAVMSFEPMPVARGCKP